MIPLSVGVKILIWLFRCVAGSKEATLYYREVLRSLKGKVRIMGHSKGGNLSVYSAVRGGKLGQKRLLKVYCLDGPGFSEDFFLRFLSKYQ